MAKVEYGNIIVDMKGKVSGNVYARNKGGAYSRVRVKPTNPKSVAQQAIRSSLTQFAQAWRELAEVERTSWLQGASAFARKNNLGKTHILSGNALFVSLNRNLSDVAQAPLVVCPTPQSVTPIAVESVVASEGGNTVTLTLTGAVDAGTAVKVFATEALSAGINSAGSKLRQIGYIAPSSAAIVNLTTDYNAKFGTVGAEGSKIFYRLEPVNIATGQLGSPSFGVAVIGA